MLSKLVLHSSIMCLVMSLLAKSVLFFWIMGGFLGGICAGGAIQAMFIFGDSLVDAGNNNYINTLSRANSPPNGIDLLPSRQPTGRFTNGRTVVDILGQQLGVPNFAPPYLAPTTTGAAILNGVNYASGAGGILNNSGAIFGGRINLDAQLDNYANTRQDLISMLGMPAAVSRLRKSIFSITIGSNDFLDNYLTPILSLPDRLTMSPDMFIEGMISKYRQQIVRLYTLDARKFLVNNVGPIGCIPFSRDTTLFSGTDCVEVPNQLARNFNEKLKDLVMELSSSLQGAHFAYANDYGIVSDILQNYNSYGFEVVNSACCFAAGRFGGLIPCGRNSRVCPDHSKYFFWDPYHPSEAANIIIAKRLLDGDLNDIFPMNVRQLAQA